MKQEDLYVLMNACLITIANLALILIGERRIDVYMSLTILIYFVTTGLIGYGAEVRGRGMKILTTVFLIIFVVIVSYRIWKIIFPTQHPLDIVFGG